MANQENSPSNVYPRFPRIVYDHIEPSGHHFARFALYLIFHFLSLTHVQIFGIPASILALEIDIIITQFHEKHCTIKMRTR